MKSRSFLLARLLVPSAPYWCLTWSSRVAVVAFSTSQPRRRPSSSYPNNQRGLRSSRQVTGAADRSVPPTTDESFSSSSGSYAQRQTQLSQSWLPLVGGDFAGYTATYDPHSGAVQPVPPHWVPKSLLEWGEHPRTLEVIVSEDVVPPRVNDKDGAGVTTESSMLNRTCLTVLPEAGCGIDNLEVQKHAEPTWEVLGGSTDQCVGLVQTGKQGVALVETIFPALQEDEHRIRVTIGVSTESLSSSIIQLASISVAVEQRFDPQSSKGNRANGGGLDAASVFQWVGQTITKNGVKLLTDSSQPGTSAEEKSLLQLPNGVSVRVHADGETLGSAGVSVATKHAGMRYEWNGPTTHPVGSPL